MERSRAVSSRKCTGFVCMSSAATLYTPPQMKPAVPATTTSGTPINQTRLRVFGCMYVLPSEPDSNAGHDPGVVDVPGPCATLVRRSAVGTLPDDADIGSELPMELVAQAETGFDLAQSAADSNRRIVLEIGSAAGRDRVCQYELRISDWSSDVCSSDLKHACVSSVACMFSHQNQIRTPATTRVSSTSPDRARRWSAVPP